VATNKISEITNYFSKGFQRTNRFEVVFSRGNKTFWASQSQVPQQYTVYYPDNMAPSGPLMYFPVKREYDERFIVDFIVESDWAVRKYFEEWYDSMFSSIDNGRSNTVSARNTGNILSDITIKALNENGNTNATFTLYEAFPKTLLPSQFSNDVPNQYLTLSVDFSYRYYRLV
jgi:hypothetical protein